MSWSVPETLGPAVDVAPGQGRRWVVAASKRGKAYAVRRTAMRVYVGYYSGTGRLYGMWVPAEAVSER